MLQNYQPLTALPADIQRDWQAQLCQAVPTANGVFRLVAARRTSPKTFEEQRVIVLVIDENGFPIPNVPVAFAYSTANFYPIAPDFAWTPPSQNAFVVPTTGGGQIDQVQGSGVRQGQPGGITAFILHPEFSSDYVTGAGMLADHTGLHLTFQLRRIGVRPIAERLQALEDYAGDSGELARRLYVANSQITNLQTFSDEQKAANDNLSLQLSMAQDRIATLTAQVNELLGQNKAHY